MVPTKNRSDLRGNRCGEERLSFCSEHQLATYHNPTMAKYKLSDLIKSEWDKGRESCSGVTSTPEQKSTPEQLPSSHWVETYHPSNRPQYTYYRYVWMEKQKMHHRHIKGSAASPKAIAMKEKVLDAIEHGSTAANIVAMIVKGDNRA